MHASMRTDRPEVARIAAIVDDGPLQQRGSQMSDGKHTRPPQQQDHHVNNAAEQHPQERLEDITAFTRSLAKSLAVRGIRVNGVAPGARPL